MKKRISYVCILTTALVFSLMEIVLKLASNQVTGLNGIQISFWRFVIAVACFLPFMMRQIKRQKISFTGKDWRNFILLGFVFVVCCMSMYQISCKLEPAAIAAIIFSCNPVFVLLFSKLILHKRLTGIEKGTLFFALTGMVLVVSPHELLSQLNNWQGILISISGSALFGLYTVLSKRYLNENPGANGFIISGMSFLCGLVELWIVIGLTHISVISNFFKAIPSLQMFSSVPVIRNLTPANVGILLFIGIVITAVGYGCYFYAVENAGSFPASSSFFIKSILAPILATIILHEQMKLTVIIGTILVIIGLALPFVFKKKGA